VIIRLDHLRAHLVPALFGAMAGPKPELLSGEGLGVRFSVSPTCQWRVGFDYLSVREVWEHLPISHGFLRGISTVTLT
jgi:hypothetical protein